MNWLSPWIHTTDKCNMACDYCYVTGNNVMEKPVYDALESMLLNSGAGKIQLRMAGGEPLLVFDRWRGFVERMINNRSTHVEILTNLTLIPDGFAQLAEREHVNISVSIDAGSRYKKLDQFIIDRMSKIQNPYWIMTTITEDNIDNLLELADFVGNSGYGWSTSTDYFWKGSPTFEKLAVEMTKVLTLLKHLKYNFNQFSFNNASFDGSTGCHAGDNMFSVYCDGNIYACQTLNCTKKKIGSVFEGYERRERLTPESCSSCVINKYCSGWCPLYHRPRNAMCDLIKLVVHEILREV